jgi:secreted trypsin-like serine protease
MKHLLIGFTLLSTFLTTLSACRNSKESFDVIQADVDANIVNGKLVVESTDSSASTVLLLVKKNEGSGVCTGTLIASNVILTAAHCAPNNEGESAAVGFGKNIEESFSTTATLRPAYVMSSIINPIYKADDPGKNSVNDLALLKFSGEAPPQFKIRNLPEKTYSVSATDELELIGFGRTSEEKDDSGTLRYTHIPASQIVKTIYDDETKMNYSLPGNIALLQPLTGVCRGDSGGPLFAKSFDGKLTLIGVASKGGNIQNKAKWCQGYSLFVDVRYQLDWIKTTLTFLIEQKTSPE